jgi:uncharacterized protein (TIGR02117 family)
VTTSPPHAGLPRAEPAKVVHLVGHGWHVGIALARADIDPAVWPESGDLGALRFLEVGWGDGGFYPSAQGTVPLALKAALASESTVLHVVGFDPPVREFFAHSNVVEVPLAPEGFAALCRFIAGAYARDAGGRPVVVAPGLYGQGRFYRATGRYRLFDNSNTWTARALAVGGCPVDPAQVITAGAVLDAGRACRDRR